jgi:formylglycine-generating enzyme
VPNPRLDRCDDGINRGGSRCRHACAGYTLKTNVKCDSTYQTWTDGGTGNEQLPINCVDWYEAFAFCIWDGGRLPTEAEWEYAAAGGNSNRIYPWVYSPPDNTVGVFGCQWSGTTSCAFADIASVGSVPAGAGRWGHQDLAGSMWEWVFDWYDSGWYGGGGSFCNDCANTSASTSRVIRSGSWYSLADSLRAANRNDYAPASRNSLFGLRCARTP